MIKTPQCVVHKKKAWKDKFPSLGLGANLWFGCVWLEDWELPHTSGNRASTFLPQPWSLAAGGITWSTSVQWPKCRFTATAASCPAKPITLWGLISSPILIWCCAWREGEMCGLASWALSGMSGTQRQAGVLCAQRWSAPVSPMLSAFCFPLYTEIALNVDPPPVRTKGQMSQISVGVDNTPKPSSIFHLQALETWDAFVELFCLIAAGQTCSEKVTDSKFLGSELCWHK